MTRKRYKIVNMPRFVAFIAIITLLATWLFVKGCLLVGNEIMTHEEPRWTAESWAQYVEEQTGGKK